MRNRGAELIWVGLVALLLLLTVWWIPGSGTVNSDSYSVTLPGRKVLFRTLSRLEEDVRRSERQLIPDPDNYHRLLILGPARYPDSREWDELYVAVTRGMSLVFAISDRDPVLDLEVFGVQIRADKNDTLKVTSDAASRETDETGETGDSKPEQTSRRKAGSASLSRRDSSPTETDLVNNSVTWPHPRRFTRSGLSGDEPLDESTWETLVRAGGEAQVIRRRIGLGQIIVVSSDNLFSNRSLMDEDQALLAVRIIEAAETPGATWFDETLNSSGTPKVFGILFDAQFRPMTLQLILVAVIFGWSGARRFGPAVRQFSRRRRSIVEHAQALGTLYFQGRSGQQVVERALEHLRSDVRHSFGTGVAADDPALLARLARRELSEVRELIQTAQAIVNAERVSNAQAALVLGQLIELRQQICGVRGRR